MNIQKNILKKNKKKINIFIDNHPSWGGTFQYTQIMILSLSKIKEFELKVYFTHDEWGKNLKNFNHQFVKFHKFEKYFLIFLILLKIEKFIYILKYFNLTNLPKDFFDKNILWFFPSQDLLSILCRGKKFVSVHDLMHRYVNFPEISSPLRKIYRDILFNRISRDKIKI